MHEKIGFEKFPEKAGLVRRLKNSALLSCVIQQTISNALQSVFKAFMF
jgi:hypothetical protein